MNIEIMDSPWVLTLTGTEKIHDPDKSVGVELIELLNKVWEAVKSRDLPNTGINYAVYGSQGEIFAGVVITAEGEPPQGLVTRQVVLERCAAAKYIGPYSGIPQAYQEMEEEIKRRGLVRKAPSIEIYGHWTEDPATLETDLVWALE